MKRINYNITFTSAQGAGVKTGVANLSISKIANNTMATDEPRSVNSCKQNKNNVMKINPESFERFKELRIRNYVIDFFERNPKSVFLEINKEIYYLSSKETLPIYNKLVSIGKIEILSEERLKQEWKALQLYKYSCDKQEYVIKIDYSGTYGEGFRAVILKKMSEGIGFNYEEACLKCYKKCKYCLPPEAPPQNVDFKKIYGLEDVVYSVTYKDGHCYVSVLYILNWEDGKIRYVSNYLDMDKLKQGVKIFCNTDAYLNGSKKINGINRDVVKKFDSVVNKAS